MEYSLAYGLVEATGEGLCTVGEGGGEDRRAVVELGALLVRGDVVYACCLRGRAGSIR